LVLFFKKEHLFLSQPHRMTLLLLAALSACITVIMIRVGTLDHPVARSSHTRPTPKGGGVGIAAASLAGLMLGPDHAGVVLPAAALCLAVVSYVDDGRDLPFWVKMAAQAAASVALVAAGHGAHSVAVSGLGTIALGWAGPLLSVLWLVFVTNAVNFMDGLNGLASGSAAVACAGMVAVSGLPAAWPEAALIAGVIGFLPFNYPIARIFMGDVGSQFLGFMLAALALRHAGDARLSAILPCAMVPMLADVAVTLIRRWRQGERLTEAHRSHFYQIAHQSGMPAARVTMIYWFMAAMGAICGAVLGWTTDRLFSLCLIPVALLPFAVWAATGLRLIKKRLNAI
jgi:UDP-GlcNAc:undecaprenyl-phosphate GlcNAc-1-phosphate transferase